MICSYVLCLARFIAVEALCNNHKSPPPYDHRKSRSRIMDFRSKHSVRSNNGGPRAFGLRWLSKAKFDFMPSIPPRNFGHLLDPSHPLQQLDIEAAMVKMQRQIAFSRSPPSSYLVQNVFSEVLYCKLSMKPECGVTTSSKRRIVRTMFDTW